MGDGVRLGIARPEKRCAVGGAEPSIDAGEGAETEDKERGAGVEDVGGFELGFMREMREYSWRWKGVGKSAPPFSERSFRKVASVPCACSNRSMINSASVRSPTPMWFSSSLQSLFTSERYCSFAMADILPEVKWTAHATNGLQHPTGQHERRGVRHLPYLNGRVHAEQCGKEEGGLLSL